MATFASANWQPNTVDWRTGRPLSLLAGTTSNTAAANRLYAQWDAELNGMNGHVGGTAAAAPAPAPAPASAGPLMDQFNAIAPKIAANQAGFARPAAAALFNSLYGTGAAASAPPQVVNQNGVLGTMQNGQFVPMPVNQTVPPGSGNGPQQAANSMGNKFDTPWAPLMYALRELMASQSGSTVTPIPGKQTDMPGPPTSPVAAYSGLNPFTDWTTQFAEQMNSAGSGGPGPEADPAGVLAQFMAALGNGGGAIIPAIHQVNRGPGGGALAPMSMASF